MDKEISKIYFDSAHPAGYSGFTKLRKYIPKRISNEYLKQFLEKQEAYTLHAPVTRRFKRDQIFVTNIDDGWQADLIDMQKFKKHNLQVTFLLIVVDVLSRFMWIRCLKNKTGLTVKLAFQDIIETSKRQPISLATDKGTEFYNETMKNYLDKLNINHFSTENSDIKCSIAERAIRTIKQKLWRYFTHTGNNLYVDVLQNFVKSYNHSVHRTIGTAPASVNENNFLHIWRKLYKSQRNIISESHSKLKVNDNVRISKLKLAFAKGYENNWSKEIFVVKRVIQRRPQMYEISDLNDEKIKGRFYAKELQRVVLPEFHKINKIIRTRGKGPSKELYVSWEGYPEEFNSWIKETHLKT